MISEFAALTTFTDINARTSMDRSLRLQRGIHLAASLCRRGEVFRVAIRIQRGSGGLAAYLGFASQRNAERKLRPQHLEARLKVGNGPEAAPSKNTEECPGWSRHWATLLP